MDDLERQVDFCKPKKETDCDDQVSKSTDKSEAEKENSNEEACKAP